MTALVTRAFFPHLLGYVITFVFFGIIGTLESQDPDYVILACLFLLAWAAGPALFGFDSRLRMERFLRTLPVTHREIIIARFLASLLLQVICWIVLLFITATLSRTPEQATVCLKFVCAAAGWSLAGGGLAHFWGAHHGRSILAGVLLNVALVVFTVSFVALHSRPARSFDTGDSFLVSTVTAAPWAVQLLYPLAGLWIFIALMNAAAATSRPRDGE